MAEIRSIVGLARSRRRVPVSSSALRSVGYDARTRTFEVEFASAGVYRYLDVDPAEVTAFFAAESKGRYVNEHIKPHHRCVYLGPA